MKFFVSKLLLSNKKHTIDVSNYVYLLDDGMVTLTKYIGEDEEVVVPTIQ